MSLVSKVQIVQKTDRGKLRSHNEDSVGSEPSMGLAILADGMGGHNSGEIASAMAVADVLKKFNSAYTSIQHGEVDGVSGLTHETELLRKSIEEASRNIYEASEASLADRGMGTTAVSLLFLDNKVSIAHVGDSRAYRLRGSHFEVLTQDHSLIQELVREGFYTREEAARCGQKNVITRALGIAPQVEVDAAEETVDVDDIYLMCSDGLTDMVTDDSIRRILEETRHDIESAADKLVMRANDNGGADNISVVLARIHDPFPFEESFAK